MNKALPVFELNFPSSLFSETAAEQMAQLRLFLERNKGQAVVLATANSQHDYHDEWLQYLQRTPKEHLAYRIFEVLRDLDSLTPYFQQSVFVANHDTLGSIHLIANQCHLRIVRRPDIAIGCDEFSEGFFLPLGDPFSSANERPEALRLRRFFSGQLRHSALWVYDPIPVPDIKNIGSAVVARLAQHHFATRPQVHMGSALPQIRSQEFLDWQSEALSILQQQKTEIRAIESLTRKQLADRNRKFAYQATWLAHQGKRQAYQSFLTRQQWQLPQQPTEQSSPRLETKVVEVHCQAEHLPAHSVLQFLRHGLAIHLVNEDESQVLHYGNVILGELEKYYKPHWAKKLWDHRLSISFNSHGTGFYSQFSLDIDGWVSLENPHPHKSLLKFRLMGFTFDGDLVLEQHQTDALSQPSSLTLLPCKYFLTKNLGWVESTSFSMTDIIRCLVLCEMWRLSQEFKMSFHWLLQQLFPAAELLGQMRNQWQKFANTTFQPLRSTLVQKQDVPCFSLLSKIPLESLLDYLDSSSQTGPDNWSTTHLKRHMSLFLHLLHSATRQVEVSTDLMYWASGLSLHWTHWTQDLLPEQILAYQRIYWPMLVSTQQAH